VQFVDLKAHQQQRLLVREAVVARLAALQDQDQAVAAVTPAMC